MLANALVERAHAIVESDWREAEKLAREALDLNPAHPMGKTIRTLILDQKRETYVEECVSQARKLQTAADPPEPSLALKKDCRSILASRG